jgi:hypothetical protein
MLRPGEAFTLGASCRAPPLHRRLTLSRFFAGRHDVACPAALPVPSRRAIAAGMPRRGCRELLVGSKGNSVSLIRFPLERLSDPLYLPVGYRCQSPPAERDESQQSAGQGPPLRQINVVSKFHASTSKNFLSHNASASLHRHPSGASGGLPALHPGPLCLAVRRRSPVLLAAPSP